MPIQSDGETSRISMQLLDPQEYEDVNSYDYSKPTYSIYPSRPLPRRYTYLLGALAAIFFLAAISIRSHVIPNPLPVLDTSSEAVQAASTVITQQPFRKAVILSSYESQEVGWLRELDSNLTSGWEIFRYVGDAPAKASDDFLTLPNPDGREGLTYLTFIVDNYDNLPDYSIFIHGHDKAWHQPEYIVDKLSAINLTALREEQYFNLRCNISPGCTPDTKFYYDGTHTDDHRVATRMKDFWDDKMSGTFGPLPPVIGRRCCAQFAAHKSAILKQPKQFWEAMREPLLDGPGRQKEKWRGDMSGHRVGLYYENIWHILFGKPADYCPPTEHCEKVQFQDKIHCDGEVMTWAENDKWTDIKCYNDLRVEAGWQT